MENGESSRAWVFVGECGLDDHGEPPTNIDEYLFRLNAGLALLRTAFGEPPNGCVLEVIRATAPHGEGDFPIIAVGFEGKGDAAEQYASRLEEGLEKIDEAIDWNRLSHLTPPREN